MIADEERIVEGGQSADHIETGVLDFLNTGLVFLLRVVGVGIRRGRVFAEDLGIIADRRAIHDVDNEGVDLRGLGVGDVGNIVLRDRRHLSQDGLMIVVVAMDKYSGEILSGPDIISRGFVYVRESEELMDEARNVVQQALEQCDRRSSNEWAYIKTLIKDTLRDYLWHKTKRSPMILPIVMDIE